MKLVRRGERHGATRSKEYRAWVHIRERCENPNDKAFHNYGGRGLTVCEAWRASYGAFLGAVGRAPTPKHSLDRIDNDRGYEPGNVRWATTAQQSRNTRRTILVGGQSLTDYCATHGLSYEAVQMRIRRGHPLSLATSPLTGTAYRRVTAEAVRHD